MLNPEGLLYVQQAYLPPESKVKMQLILVIERLVLLLLTIFCYWPKSVTVKMGSCFSMNPRYCLYFFELNAVLFKQIFNHFERNKLQAFDQFNDDKLVYIVMNQFKLILDKEHQTATWSFTNNLK
jgi:hypothetical protein